MIDSWPILSIVTFLPLAGVLFLLMIRGDEAHVSQRSRLVALRICLGSPFSCRCPCGLCLITV